MAVKTLTINDQLISALEEQTILEAARDAVIHIPTLCYLEGVSEVGACRLCLVEIAGNNKLQPACVAKVTEGMEVKTDTPKLQNYRRTIVEMLFAEGNHICSVCVANGNYELQDLAIEMEKNNHFILDRHADLHQHRQNDRFKKHIRRTDRVEVQVEDDRTGMSVETLKRAFADNLYYLIAKDEYWANLQNYYMALAYTVRDRLLHRWIQTTKT